MNVIQFSCTSTFIFSFICVSPFYLQFFNIHARVYFFGSSTIRIFLKIMLTLTQSRNTLSFVPLSIIHIHLDSWQHSQSLQPLSFRSYNEKTAGDSDKTSFCWRVLNRCLLISRVRSFHAIWKSFPLPKELKFKNFLCLTFRVITSFTKLWLK